MPTAKLKTIEYHEIEKWQSVPAKLEKQASFS